MTKRNLKTPKVRTDAEQRQAAIDSFFADPFKSQTVLLPKPTRTFAVGEEVELGGLKNVIIQQSLDEGMAYLVHYIRSDRHGDIESLHQQLADCQTESVTYKRNTDLAYKGSELETLNKLAECERDRSEWATVAESAKVRADVMKEQLASVTKERDEFIRAIADHVTVRGELTQQRNELVEALEEYVNADLDDACLNSRKRFAKEALAKVGAGKTGEGS